jgi:RimJ/RimL family protein N-acetyltransferase
MRSIIETERLLLRMPTADDFDGYLEMWTDPRVAEPMGGKPGTRFSTWQALAAQIGHWQMRGFGLYTVIEKQTGKFVGRVGPWCPEGWPGLEVGWTLLYAMWGNGYATEAAEACVGDVFASRNDERIISLILPTNQRSIAVAERIGERPDGEVRLDHDPDRRILRYAIRREEWEATR